MGVHHLIIHGVVGGRKGGTILVLLRHFCLLHMNALINGVYICGHLVALLISSKHDCYLPWDLFKYKKWLLIAAANTPFISTMTFFHTSQFTQQNNFSMCGHVLTDLSLRGHS